MRKDISGSQRLKFKKSERMMRKDVSGGPSSKNSKMMRKDVSGGQSSKNPKK
jgi:hypothetical protein